MDKYAPKPSIAIVGIGRLGSQLCRWLSDARYQVTAMASRNVERMRDVATLSQSSAALFQTPPEVLAHADITFITQPDGLIGALAQEIADTGVDLSGKLIVHCSGAQTAELLAPLRSLGARVGVAHPIQAFTPLSAETKASPFSRISIGIEAIDADYVTLATMADLLGAKAMPLTPDPAARARYHAAAVLASNALVAFMDAAGALLGEDGHDEAAARAALIPLVAGTLRNLEKMPATEALTGPVARGDAKTLSAHLAAMPEELKPLYRESMRRAVAIALRAKRIDASQAAALLAAIMV